MELCFDIHSFVCHKLCPIVDVQGLASPLNHTTLLDELLFWVVKFEFPQKIVTLLLSILPDDDYKVKQRLI